MTASPPIDELSSFGRARSGASCRYAMADAWHPGIVLAYVVVVVVIACAMPDLVILIPMFIGGSLWLLQAEGVRAMRTIGMTLVLGCAVALIAPLFDTAGESVLFAYFGRFYTFEALMRGASTGALVASMLVWFVCLFRIVSSDGILQVAGRIAPRVGMVSSLVMQMVPRLARRAARVSSARLGAGLAPREDALIARMREVGAVFSTVAADSLERSIVCADAMESRGYGTGARTSAVLEPFAQDEGAFLVIAIVLLLLFVGALGMRALTSSATASVAGATAFGALVFLPVLFNAVEDLRWRI